MLSQVVGCPLAMTGVSFVSHLRQQASYSARRHRTGLLALL